MVHLLKVPNNCGAQEINKHSQRSQLVSCSSSLWPAAFQWAPASWAKSSCPPLTARKHKDPIKTQKTGPTSVWQQQLDAVRTSHLVRQLLHFPLVASDPLLILLALLLLQSQLRLQRPHLHTQQLIYFLLVTCYWYGGGKLPKSSMNK